uniref:Uncharacterized protein n=1 Tax=Romanomermis culicivorax TaxID=13658 RepID=A0A915J6I5_ROMCU
MEVSTGRVFLAHPSSNVCIFLIRRPNFRGIVAARSNNRTSCLVEIAKRRTMCNELALCCPTIKECAEQQSAMKNSELSTLDLQFAEQFRNMRITTNASTI